MQKALKDLEARLDRLFGEGSPYQVSDKHRQALAGSAWAIILIIGIFQVWGAIGFWQLGHTATTLINYANYVSSTYGNGPVAPQLSGFFYLAFLALLGDAILLLMAVPSLKDLHKHGWELVYYGLLLNIVYTFCRVFSSVGGGFGQFIVQLFFSAVAAYFLFQVRIFFGTGKLKVEVPPAKNPGLILDEQVHHTKPHSSDT
jgi:hypothetical protein